MVTRTFFSIASAALSLSIVVHARPAAAAPPAAPPDAPGGAIAMRPELVVPRAHHAPLATARAREDLRIQVTIEHGEVVKNAGVVYRSPKGELRQVPLLRGESDFFVAVIPGDDVLAPSLAYAIEIERTDGRRVAAFASRADLHPVQVLEDRADARERALLKRVDGRRSVLTVNGEFVRFGTTQGKSPIPCAAGQSACAAGTMVIPSVEDQYWRMEAGYTYRPLRTVAEFGLRIGVVRGTSLVSLSQYDASKYEVGLNYASPSVRFRMADAWHLDLSVLTSITEIGFSVGGGTQLLIGDPQGTRLTLGAEAVGISKLTYFGSRFYGRLDLAVHSRVIVAPVIEVTDMPHAEAFGVRLYGDVNAYLGRGFSIGVRGGYQARRSTSGGVGLGGNASFAF